MYGAGRHVANPRRQRRIPSERKAALAAAASTGHIWRILNQAGTAGPNGPSSPAAVGVGFELRARIGDGEGPALARLIGEPSAAQVK
jgi:hypothetical protein